MLYCLHVSTELIDGAKTYRFHVLDLLHVSRVILVAAGTVSTFKGCYASRW